MTQPADSEERPANSGLSCMCWLVSVVAVSVVGSLIAFAGVFAIQLYRLGDVAAAFSRPSILGQLKYVVLISLGTNLCGCLALMACFAIRDRAKKA